MVKFFMIAMLLSADDDTIRPDPGATANDHMVSVCTLSITSAQYQSPASSARSQDPEITVRKDSLDRHTKFNNERTGPDSDCFIVSS